MIKSNFQEIKITGKNASVDGLFRIFSGFKSSAMTNCIIITGSISDYILQNEGICCHDPLILEQPHKGVL